MPEQRYKYLEPAALAKLDRFDIVAKGVVEGFITGLHRSPYHGFSVEFAEHREYVAGDNIRDIDWQAYGRSDRYMIKQYQEETNLRAHILLDRSGSMGYKSDEASITKLDYGCFLAACLAYLLARQQDPVGLVLFDDEVRTFIPPGSTTVHLNLMLRELEKIEPGRQTNVSGSFHHLAEHINRRGLIIIISDLYDDQTEVLRSLRHFRYKKHEVMLFHVFDQAEIEFPFDRLTNFVDLETDERIQVDPKYVREEYTKLIREFIDVYKNDCSASQVEYIQTHTGL
ncbi:MAG: DUF58 domain-containing protein, partial [Planctomycetota bacterium]